MSARRTVIVDADRDQRVIVGEVDDGVYLAMPTRASFLNPVDALRAGFAIVDAATRALERQFQQQATERDEGVGRANKREGAALHGS